MNLEQIGAQAKQASYQLAMLSSEQKNQPYKRSVYLYWKTGMRS